MAKLLTAELRAGLAAVASLPGVTIQAQPAWNMELQRWYIRCRIAAAVPPGSLVSAETDWYVLVDDHYPNGCIGIYPAKDGGITQTFPHQNYNGAGQAERPWRTGLICTWTSVAPLQRRGYDVEPAEPERNLAWHLERAQAWLELASKNQLVAPGDPYELTYIPNPGKQRIAFCESPATLGRWQETAIRCGTAAAQTLETDAPIIAITNFNVGRRHPPIEQEWRKAIGNNTSQLVIWVRINKEPALPPWQIPTRWAELRRACRMQDVDLDNLLQTAISNRTVDNALLLIGFPIPDTIEGPDIRMHWLSLHLPAMASQSPGFRNNAHGRWLAYKRNAISDSVTLNWLPTENWSYDEVSVRGRLDARAARQRILIIGAGAVGSVFAELLARAGAWDIAIIDSDCLEAGNLVRHTLLMDDIGRSKATALAERLNYAALHSEITAIPVSFPPRNPAQEQNDLTGSYDVIIDTTGADTVAAAMSKFPWDGDKTFISVSLGIHAQRLFFFTARRPSFPNADFREQLQPWLHKERSTYDLNDFPRDGPGCWHPRHPARIDDVWMLTAAAVKMAEQAIIKPPGTPSLSVLESQTDFAGNFAGIRVASQDEMPQ